jgi:hypothetical protein
MAKKLLLKCDLRLIPILGSLYLVSFLDRSNIANAVIEGFEKDLEMPSNGFNNCLWIFYLPFVIIELPSNIILSWDKIHPSQWLGSMMFLLGTSSWAARRYCSSNTSMKASCLCARVLLRVMGVFLPADLLWAYWRPVLCLVINCSFSIRSQCLQRQVPHSLLLNTTLETNFLSDLPYSFASLLEGTLSAVYDSSCLFDIVHV